MKRPGVVTFNALLNLLTGLLFTVVNIAVLTGSNPHAGGSAWHFWEYDWDVVKIIGPLTILSIASLFVFFGLWRLRSWGRTLFNGVNLIIGVVLLALAITGGVEGFEVESGKARIIVGLVSLIFFLAPVGMAKPEIKEAFKA
jgi:hypothetical protein